MKDTTNVKIIKLHRLINTLSTSELIKSKIINLETMEGVPDTM